MSDEHKSGTIENWASGGQLEIKILREQIAALKAERDRYQAEHSKAHAENAKLREALLDILGCVGTLQIDAIARKALKVCDRCGATWGKFGPGTHRCRKKE